jgi:hypothetical protein
MWAQTRRAQNNNGPDCSGPVGQTRYLRARFSYFFFLAAAFFFGAAFFLVANFIV